MKDLFTFRFSHIPKLFTHEDVGNLHKTLGFLVLLHYGYRMREWADIGRITIGEHQTDATPIVIHGMLSWTSLMFHLPSARNPRAPMIYREFRLHSIFFATRSLVAILFVKSHMIKSINVILTMVCADIATSIYKHNGSTMRSMPFPSYVSPSFITVWNYGYSIAQVFATLEVLMRDTPGNAFMVMFPIQLAAFLMTCVRKGIITAGGWHMYYSLSLLSTFMYGIKSKDTFTTQERMIYLGCALYFCIMRFVLRLSKYGIWATIICIYLYTKSDAFANQQPRIMHSRRLLRMTK